MYSSEMVNAFWKNWKSILGSWGFNFQPQPTPLKNLLTWHALGNTDEYLFS